MLDWGGDFFRLILLGCGLVLRGCDFVRIILGRGSFQLGEFGVQLFGRELLVADLGEVNLIPGDGSTQRDAGTFNAKLKRRIVAVGVDLAGEDSAADNGDGDWFGGVCNHGSDRGER